MPMAEVQPIFSPAAEAMRQHLEHLFGGYLDGCHDGLIELAWTDTRPDESGRYRLKNAAYFGTDQFDDLIAEAVRLNSTPMCNVYIGAALRKPGAAPFGRSKDEDAYALTAVYTDLDDQGATAAAKDVYGESAKPTMVVVTGREPHTRAQLWWRLDEPITDPAAWPDLLRGMAKAMGGDPSVCNAGRVMRLAGTVAWPVKEGRTATELTAIVPLQRPGQSAYSAGHLASAFPPVASSAPGGIDTGAGVVRATSSLGLLTKVNDGREKYMLKTIAALLLEYVGETGAVPDPQELFDISWPQYERGADLTTRAGRGKDEFARKCQYTIKRFERGEIRGLETVDKAVEVYAKKKLAREACPEQHDLLPPARQDGVIKTADFMTLATESVEEEPDMIEPGFAGPGSFGLIAGPPKAQKSFLLQEILVAAATGGSFLNGVFTVPRPLRVFWLQAEMNRKLLRARARTFKDLTGEEKGLLSRNLIISERFHMILNEGGVKTAVETIRGAFPDGPPDIIAIDPLANVFDAENENDNAQLMRFLTGRIEAIRQQINPMAFVILVHHATKKSADDMARDPFVAIRGASALRGYYDSAIVIYRPGEDTKARKVHFELRSGESPEPMTVQLVNGRFEQADKVASQIDIGTAHKLLGAIRSAWEQNEPLSSHPQSKRDGRYAIENLAQQFNLPPGQVAYLLNEWLKNHVVTMRERKPRVRSAGLEVTGQIG